MTSLIMPIIFPKPYSDESPVGYLIRVAQKNAYKRINWLYRQESTMMALAPSRLLEDLLAAKWSGFDKISKTVKEICKLQTSNLNYSSMRFCPRCIKEHEYHRAKWYLGGTAVCLEHGCWLVDKCPECHSEILFREMISISECSCGASLIDSELKPASITAIRFTKFFEGSAKSNDDNFAFSDVFDGTLYTLESRVIITRVLLRWCLSSSDFYYKTGNPTGLNSMLMARECIDSFSQSWFSSIDEFINYITTLHQKIHHDQVDGDELFRSFYKNIFRDFLHPKLNPIKDTIRTYMNDHWIHSIDKRNSLFVKEAINDHCWLALQVASRDLEVPKSVIKDGIKSGDIRNKLILTKSRSQILVHRDDVIKIKQIKASYVNAVTAASLLGVTKKQMVALTESELIKKDNRLRRSQGGLYSLDDLGELMYDLNYSLVVAENDTCSLSQAIRKIGNGIENPFISLVSAVMSGDVKAELDPQYIGFRRLRIDTKELKRWYKEKTKYDTSGYFTQQSLRKHFQVSSDFIPQLVRSGLISKYSKNVAGCRSLISIEQVSQFKERYVLLSKLSLCSFIPSVSLMKKLSACGVYPVDYDWIEADKFIQKIYYRHELLAVPEFQVLLTSMEDWEYESFYPDSR